MWTSIVIAVLGLVLTYMQTLQAILTNQWQWNLTHLLSVATATLVLASGVVGILTSAGVAVPEWIKRLIADIQGFLTEMALVSVRRSMKREAKKAAQRLTGVLLLALRTLVVGSIFCAVLLTTGCGIPWMTIAQKVVDADELFLDAAAAAWPVVKDQLPEPESEKIYTDACAVISTLDTGLESAISIGKAPGDLLNDIAQINKAIAAIEKLIQQWETFKGTAVRYQAPADQAKINRLKVALMRAKLRVAEYENK